LEVEFWGNINAVVAINILPITIGLTCRGIAGIASQVKDGLLIQGGYLIPQYQKDLFYYKLIR
jgi:hypothetical protein